ncbi:MAG: type II secretion system F family protein [Pirellulales bacterium]|nr:type II secretion system F family protein [Pirellulales bacterium]
MNFAYSAKTRAGQLTHGEIQCDTLADARQKLRSQGLYVVSLVSGQRQTIVARFSRPTRGRGKVRTADLLLFLSQLSILCQSGEDLAEALKQVAEQFPQPALRAVLNALYQDVTAGTSLSDAMRKHPRVFDESFVAAICAGEQSGTITQVLERLTQLLRGDLRLRGSVWSMLTYPLVLCAVTGMVIVAMFFFVLPQFAQVFADLERPAPPLTAFLLGIGDVLRQQTLLVALLLGGVCAGGWMFARTPLARQLWDRFCLYAVPVKHASRALITGRIFRLLGTMLTSGVPLIEGIRLCRAASRNHLYKELFAQAEQEILRGEALGKSLRAVNFLPLGAAHMVSTAERTGKLGQVLQAVGEHFEDDGERHLRDLIRILEPAIIVMLGVVVAVVVLAIIMPLLDVSTISN